MLIKKKTLFNSIINYITKKGEKKIVKHLFFRALEKTSKKTKLSCQYLLVRVFKKLQIFVEHKQIVKRKKHFSVPFPITLKRQRYLSIKWFFNAVKENKGPGLFSDKICLELIAVLKEKKSKAIFFKKQNIQLALANRSNIHYRW